MIRVVLLVQAPTNGDELLEVESWDWFSILNAGRQDRLGRWYQPAESTEVEVEVVERIVEAPNHGLGHPGIR